MATIWPLIEILRSLVLYLVEVDDGDVAMCARVSIDAVVDGQHVHHKQVPDAWPAAAMEVVEQVRSASCCVEVVDGP